MEVARKALSRLTEAVSKRNVRHPLRTWIEHSNQEVKEVVAAGVAQASTPTVVSRAKPFAANNASKKWLEADGWTVTVVEQNIPHCFVKRDAFGFADLLCCSPCRGIMLVQVTGGTSTSNFHSRISKLKAEPRHAIWLASGGRIQVHSHEKVRGSKQRKLRVLEITSAGS